MRGIVPALVGFFWGETVFTTETRPDRTVNALLIAGIPFRLLRKEEEHLVFAVRSSLEKSVRELFGKFDIPYSIGKRRGLPAWLRRCRSRPGIFVGAALFLFLLLYSRQFIWDIRVTESDGIPEEEILAALEEDGVRIGGSLGTLDLHEICAAFPLRHRQFGWIAINLMGTVAEVEVRGYHEKAKKTPQTDSVKALVAGWDGVIERMEIYSGGVVHKVGDAVCRGELLVSCVRQNERISRVENAAGKVFATVEREFQVKIPFEKSETVAGEEILLEKSIFFFGNEWKFAKRGSNSTEECAIIKKKHRLALFGRYPLPVTVTETYAVPEKTVRHRYSEEEAMELAEKELAEMVETELTGATLLQSEKKVTADEKELALTYSVRCIMDIAVPMEIGYHPS